MQRPLRELTTRLIRIQAANAEVSALLATTTERLRAVLDDETFAEETPIEVSTAMELAIESIDTALEKLKAILPDGWRRYAETLEQIRMTLRPGQRQYHLVVLNEVD